ncbi:MAG: transcription factor FapR [Bacillota bacterium]
MSKIPASIQQRHANIKNTIEKNPLITDEELASLFNVSIHTIRSDRKRIGIPEARIRARDFTETMFGQAKTLSAQEIIGDLLEVDLDKEGLSLLDTNEKMSMLKPDIIRGHILFAQANSLANAIVDAELALTGEATVKFLAPVRTGERVLAKARVTGIKGRKKTVEVIMKTKKNLVFEGIFHIHCLTRELASHMRILKDDEEKGDDK